MPIPDPIRALGDGFWEGSLLPGLIGGLGVLVVSELAISHAIERDKWEPRYTWPLALGAGGVAGLFAVVGIPALGLRLSDLVLVGWGLIIAGVGARRHIWPVYHIQASVYKVWERLANPLPDPTIDHKQEYRAKSVREDDEDGNRKSTLVDVKDYKYKLQRLLSRPLIRALKWYALLATALHIVRANVLVQTVPPALRELLLTAPPPNSLLVGALGLGGGAVVGTLHAVNQRQEANARREPPSKQGELVCAGRAAAPETSLARPYDAIEPPGNSSVGYGVDCLPPDAPSSTEDIGISNMERDYRRFPTVKNADAGKASATTGRQDVKVVSALTFDYVDTEKDRDPEDAAETPTDDATETVRFGHFAVHPDYLGGKIGQKLVDYTMWKLDAAYYSATASNPYDYQALYDLGFSYTGETTAEGVELERQGPILDMNIPHNDVTSAERPRGKRGGPVAVADAASIDRRPESYRAGLQSFLNEDEPATTLSADARAFIEDHIELDPPVYQSYSQRFFHQEKLRKINPEYFGLANEDLDSGSASEETGESASSEEERSASPADTARTDHGAKTEGAETTMTEETNHPMARRYNEAQLAQGQYDWQYSEVTFADVGGYYGVKQALADELIDPLRAAAQGDDRFERFGIEPERGILLYGPPGTGKTLFARALAGQLGVPFVELSPADVTSKWINEGPQHVKRLFAEADQLGPCVIFFDEAEHLFGARELGTHNTHAEDRKITSEFLVHLTSENREAIVVSATNRPGDIDPAILRSGRLALHIEVGLPDEEARHAIIATQLEGTPSALSGDDRAALAAHTRGFTGADLETLVDRAKRAAARRDAAAIKLDDFPSFEELDEMVEAIEHETDALPDPDDPSQLDELEADGTARSDARGGDSEDDDATRGFQ